jgi:long-subunit fatty acid transport protein
MTDTVNKYVKTEDSSKHDHPLRIWTLGAVYEVGEWVWHGGSTYKVKVAHTASADKEPGSVS